MNTGYTVYDTLFDQESNISAILFSIFCTVLYTLFAIVVQDTEHRFFTQTKDVIFFTSELV